MRSPSSSPGLYFTEGTQNKFLNVVSGDEGITGDLTPDRDNLLHKVVMRHAGSIDSIMYMTRSGVADFGMRVLEKDGSESDMCGNGVRASALLHARLMGLRFPARLLVETRSGIQEVDIASPAEITVKMKACTIHGVRRLDGLEVMTGDVGEPHAVVLGARADAYDLFQRHGIAFTHGDANDGRTINLNSVEVLDHETIAIRTFERGVDGETASCGTGATVSACVIRQLRKGMADVITVKTRGGDLRIDTRGDRPLMTGPALIKGVLPVDTSVARPAYAAHRGHLVDTVPVHMSPLADKLRGMHLGAFGDKL